MAVAGYLQINSSMSVKSSLPWRPVLSPFSTGTEKARLASTPFPGSTTAVHRSDLLPSLGPLSHSPLSTQPRPAPSLPSRPWSIIFRCAPAHQRLRFWIQQPTKLKGQGPHATLSICQAADHQGPGTEKRETQTAENLSSVLRAQR